MKRSLMFALCLYLCFLVIILLAGTIAKSETLTCIVTEGQYVNVRDKPTTKASGLGRLHTGANIEAIEYLDGWIKFVVDGQVAYVDSTYFVIEADEYAIIEANGRVRYRDYAYGKTLGYYSVGEVIHVDGYIYDSDGELWAVNNGKYCMSKFIKLQHPDENE